MPKARAMPEATDWEPLPSHGLRPDSEFVLTGKAKRETLAAISSNGKGGKK